MVVFFACEKTAPYPISHLHKLTTLLLPYLPGAIVDRDFTFSLHACRRVSAVVRVLYPDLVVDLRAVEVFESVSFPSSSSTSSSADMDTDRDRGGGGGGGGGSGGRKSKYKDSDVANVACVACVPIRIPLGKRPPPYCCCCCCCCCYCPVEYLLLVWLRSGVLLVVLIIVLNLSNNDNVHVCMWLLLC